MSRYSADSVVRIGALEELNNPVMTNWIEKAFGVRMVGRVLKQERGESPDFMRAWCVLSPVVNARTEVPETVIKNLSVGRTTILGFDNSDEIPICLNTLRGQVIEACGLGSIIARNFADQKGGIGVGIIRSLVAIKLKTED